MVINVSLQHNGGFVTGIILLTLMLLPTGQRCHNDYNEAALREQECGFVRRLKPTECHIYLDGQCLTEQAVPFCWCSFFLSFLFCFVIYIYIYIYI